MPSYRRVFNSKTRQLLYTYYDGKCQYCLVRNCVEYDHIQPVSKGGQKGLINIIPCCRVCNLKKGGRVLTHKEYIKVKYQAEQAYHWVTGLYRLVNSVNRKRL